MTRELLILRHAKSDWSMAAATDFERPLNQRGERDAPRMGRWLREQQLAPDRVVSSTALRARQTTLRVGSELGIDPAVIDWQPTVYEASLATLLHLLGECPAAPRVLLVGHNPGLDELLLWLCPEAPLTSDGKLLTTATLARLALPDDWSRLSRGSGRLLSLVRPRELRD